MYIGLWSSETPSDCNFLCCCCWYRGGTPQSPNCWSSCNCEVKVDDDKAMVDDVESVQNLGERYAKLHEGKDFCVVMVVVVVVGVVGAVVLMVVVVLMIVGECCVWEWWK